MLERTQARALPLLNRAVDVTPAVQACCGACRTCVTTNVLTLAGAGIVGAMLYIRRLARRVLKAG
jgi:hypothetical protein